MSKFFSYTILHHKSKTEKYIPVLALPKGIRRNMKFIDEKGLEYLQSIDFEIDELDTICLGTLSKPEKIILSYIDWYQRSKDIINSLNIVLADLSFFCERPYEFDGSMDTRLQLLIRTFFNEFYRSRDSWNRFLRDGERLGALSKEDIKKARGTYKQLYGDAIEVRNSLLHAFTPSGTPRDNLEIIMIQNAIDRGMYLADKETKEAIIIEDFLNDYLIKTFPLLINVGKTLRDDIQDRLEVFELAFIESDSKC